MANYSYEVVGAGDVGSEYHNGYVNAVNRLDALRQAIRIGKEKFRELYRARVSKGSIARSKALAEFFSQTAAHQRSIIESMPELKNAGPEGIARVRGRKNSWRVVKGLEARI